MISDVTQALLKPAPEFVVNFHQHIELKDEIQDKINTLDANAKDLSGQSADLFSLMSMAKTLLSKTLSDACPVCNAQYESHNALLEKIQSNGSIETALHSLLESKADLQKKIIQIDEFLDRGQSYLTTLKSSAIADISARLLNTESEVERINRELINAKHEQAVKADILHGLRAAARNLGKDDYIVFLNQAISSIKATIVRIESRLEEVLASIKATNEATDTIASNRAEILARLDVAEQDDIYTLYKNLKNQYILPDGDIVKAFSLKHNELNEIQNNLQKELSDFAENIKKAQADLTKADAYSSDILLLEKLVSLTEELSRLQDASLQIEVSLSPLVNDFSAPIELLYNELQSGKFEVDKRKAIASSSLMLANVIKAQIEDVLPFFKFREVRAKIDSHLDTKNQIERLSISLKRELRKTEIKLKERIDNFFYTDLITSIYRKIDPHPFFKTVRFECVFPIDDRPRLEVYLYEEAMSQPISPALYFSSAQLNILSLSIFLAKALHIEHDDQPVRSILIDDPIHSMDSINVLSVIDLLRNISVRFDRQIILSTHDENFYELLKLKVPEEKFGSKFIKFKSFGVVHADGNGD